MEEVPPVIVTNQLHKELIREHVPDAVIISEPVGRNTAASIALAAVHIEKRYGDAVCVVLPADHAISNSEELCRVLNDAALLAEQQSLLVTIGVRPTHPHTGYGYIKRGKAIANGGYMVDRFFEKPSLERAEQYLEAGNYLWNSGMFVWRSSTILSAIQVLMPELWQVVERLRTVVGTSAEEAATAEAFESLESISIDFGILEHARNCAVIDAAPFGWNDVGSWDAWAEHFERDAESNLLRGDVLAIESKNCVVQSEHKFTAILGVENLVVIDSGDALLICPSHEVQEVRRIVEALKVKGRKELL
jgi:mannose-1-phosphate guanylyltransferase